MYVGELKMAAPSEEKLICDKFNLEALTVNQVKSFKVLADGKDVFIGTKTGFYMKNSFIPEMFAACIINVLSYNVNTVLM
jgi:hypothetical protein